MNVQALQEMRDNGQSLRSIASQTGRSFRYVREHTEVPAIDHKTELITAVKNSRSTLSWSVEKICRVYGVSRSFVYKHAPIKTNKGAYSLTEEDIELMQALVDSGVSDSNVAVKFNVNPSVVSSKTHKPDNIISLTKLEKLSQAGKLNKEFIVTHKGYPIGTFTPN